MAIDAMRAQGYTVDTHAFADTALTVVALQRGDLDLANVSDVTAWGAIEKGAPIVLVIDDSMNPTILAAKNDLKTCAALQGKRVAVPNLTGGKTFMLHRYIDTRCPGTTPALLVVAGEGSRLAGLLAGELDAAVVDLAALRSIDSKRQSEFSAQVVFADEFPGVTALSHFARRELTEKYPATVKDWLRALLEARRRVQDPQVLANEFVTRLGMTRPLAQTTAATYLEHKFWDVNGRLTPESVQQNLDFAIAAGSLKAGVKASDVANLTLLNAVLDEIGRK
jgi:ABC-type nitrate/sulfonate/bicarbonate transport system substrate-binding protein